MWQLYIERLASPSATRETMGSRGSLGHWHKRHCDDVEGRPTSPLTRSGSHGDGYAPPPTHRHSDQQQLPLLTRNGKLVLFCNVSMAMACLSETVCGTSWLQQEKWFNGFDNQMRLIGSTIETTFAEEQ